MSEKKFIIKMDPKGSFPALVEDWFGNIYEIDAKDSIPEDMIFLEKQPDGSKMELFVAEVKIQDAESEEKDLKQSLNNNRLQSEIQNVLCRHPCKRYVIATSDNLWLTNRLNGQCSKYENVSPKTFKNLRLMKEGLSRLFLKYTEEDYTRYPEVLVRNEHKSPILGLAAMADDITTRTSEILFKEFKNLENIVLASQPEIEKALNTLKGRAYYTSTVIYNALHDDIKIEEKEEVIPRIKRTSRSAAIQNYKA